MRGRERGRGRGDKEEWRASVEKGLERKENQNTPPQKKNDTLADKRRSRSERKRGTGKATVYVNAVQHEARKQNMNKKRKERETEMQKKKSFPTESHESGEVSVKESGDGGDDGSRRRRKQGKTSRNKEKPLRAGKDNEREGVYRQNRDVFFARLYKHHKKDAGHTQKTTTTSRASELMQKHGHTHTHTHIHACTCTHPIQKSGGLECVCVCVHVRVVVCWGLLSPLK